MSDTRNATRHGLGLTPVQSMGGLLVVVPITALHQWSGCTEERVILGGTDQPHDYDRACAEGYAGAISLGSGNALALVLADEPATTCYVPGLRIFLRWLAADSDAELLAAAKAVLSDPATGWEDCGLWETDSPAVRIGKSVCGEVPPGCGMGRQRVRLFS